jgi:hypothetical protein
LSLTDSLAQCLDWIGPFDEMLIVPLLPAPQPPNETRHSQPHARKMGDYATISGKIKGEMPGHRY